MTKTLSILNETNQALAGCLDREELLDKGVSTAVDILDGDAGRILLPNDNSQTQMSLVNENPFVPRNGSDSEDESGLLKQVQAMSEVTIIDNLNQANFFEFDETNPPSGTVLRAPIRVGETILGVLDVWSAEDDVFFQDDKELLSGFAGQIGLCLQNISTHQEIIEKEQLNEDLELARTIQEQSLPSNFPEISNLDFGAKLTPAKYVSGDFYECFQLKDGKIVAAIGDVSGKGIPASMYMSQVRAELNAGFHSDKTICSIMNQINERLLDTTTRGFFVTMLVFLIDLEQDRVKVANAGHLPFFHRQDDKVERINQEKNPPMGIQTRYDCVTREISLTEESSIVVFTDGIIEAKAYDGSRYGISRVRTFLEQTDSPPGQLVEALFEDVNQFVGECTQTDDMTAISFGKTD